MDNDLPFRFALLGLLLVDLSMPAHFRRRAAAAVARAKHRRFERRLTLELILTIAAYAGIIAYVLHPETMSWSRVGLPDGVRALGIAVATLGLGGLFWAFRHLGRNLIASSEPETDHSLITTGPYHWVRHPMYSAWALLLLGYGFTTASWAVTALGAAAFAVVARRIPVEESSLIAEFGAAYKEYATRTGRFLPRFPR